MGKKFTKGVCSVCGGDAGYGRLMCQSCFNEFDFEEYANQVDQATYDPQDDKLRIYSDFVDEELYAALSTLGFARAPKQGCFYQVWSPGREQAALKLCGEIVDEDTSLIDRATDRSFRFAGYSDNANKRAYDAMRASERAVEGIPLGQPIMVGHHSEKRHRKALERAQNAASKAVQEYRNKEYWSERAGAVMSHAEWKLAPGVVTRRIKKLEAQLRKDTKMRDEAQKWMEQWLSDGLDDAKAKAIANYDGVSAEFPLSHYPRDFSTYEGMRSIWSALDAGVIGYEKAREICVRVHQRTIKRCEKWIEHLEGLIVYWKTFLVNEHGEDIDDQELAPLLKKGNWIQMIRWRQPCWGQIVRVNRSRETKRITTVSVDRTTMIGDHYTNKFGYDEISAVLDHKPVEFEELMMNMPEHKPYKRPEQNQELEAAKEQAKAVESIEVVKNWNPDFVPTPYSARVRMANALYDFFKKLGEAERVRMLEPSAGDGRLVKHMMNEYGQHLFVECCETDYNARKVLEGSGYTLVADDFSEFIPQVKYDVIVANPPWSNYQDAKHFLHAWESCLAPGGRMVFIMSAGTVPHNLGTVDVQHSIKVRQEVCEIVQEHGWSEPLPEDTFKESGVNVRATLVVVDKPKLPAGQLKMF